MEYRISTAQLAARLCVTPGTVRMWRLKGGGPAYIRIGRNRVVYRQSDIESWEGARSFTSTAEETVAREPETPGRSSATSRSARGGVL